ncbi:hypothetical protein [Aegicerativicinus sediminis]|uniref:hypothetical protein n=1 Tax=Aegicerativicinus sediminis TaxID=2893202 RepID=UPI001E55DC6C|nr:hypothetical protein [Aegicerativicinus sediminis]
MIKYNRLSTTSRDVPKYLWKKLYVNLLRISNENCLDAYCDLSNILFQIKKIQEERYIDSGIDETLILNSNDVLSVHELLAILSSMVRKGRKIPGYTILMHHNGLIPTLAKKLINQIKRHGYV